MLYDILIIDNDFANDPLSFEPKKNTKDDKDDKDVNAKNLLLALVQKNLRVTFTTGEKEELEKFDKKDLSEIKFIISDLHLQDMTGNFKSINSKIFSIINYLNNYFSEEQITIYINSKYINLDYGKEGLNDLKNIIRDTYKDKFIVDKYESKNNISEDSDAKLLKRNILHYQRSLIINKAVEVVELIESKLEMCKYCKENKVFDKKISLLATEFSLESGNKVVKELNALKGIRNALAHKRDLKESLNSQWMDILKDKIDETGSFKTLNDLAQYIKELDQLKEDIRTLTKDIPYK